MCNIKRFVLSIATIILSVSCQKEFQPSGYSIDRLLSIPGKWAPDSYISPSLYVLVSGPGDDRWDVVVTGETEEVMSFTCTTGVPSVLSLDALAFGPERLSTTVGVRISREGSGEFLFMREDIHVSVKNESQDPIEGQGIRIEQLVLSLHGSEQPVSLSPGGAVSLKFNIGDSGTLRILYSLDEGEDGPVAYTLSSQPDDTPFRIQSVICNQKGTVVMSFYAAEEGGGSVELRLCASASQTVLPIVFEIGKPASNAVLTPDRFVFADGNAAFGTLSMTGFDSEGKVRVVLCYRDVDSGQTGSTVYTRVDASMPLRVTLWNAGQADTWRMVTLWAEVYEEGETAPVTVSSEVVVVPLRPEFRWRDENGLTVRDGEDVRSKQASSTISLQAGFGTGLDGHIRKVTVRDSSSGKTFAKTSPKPNSQGGYLIEMPHPERGEHAFSVTLDTDEGSFVFYIEKGFVDVWTATPFIDGSSMYAALAGPESTLKADCHLEMLVNVYAYFTYTVAIEWNGERTDESREWWEYVETRGLDYTISAGTGNTNVKIQSGWVNTAIRQLKGLGAGRSWHGQTEASRWKRDQYGNYVKEYYTPAVSTTGAHVYIRYNEEFGEASYDLELDISRLAPVFTQNGIAYF